LGSLDILLRECLEHVLPRWLLFFPVIFSRLFLHRILKKYGKNPAIKAFVDGITAASIGAIAGAVLVLGKRTLTDIPTIIIAMSTIGLLLKFKKIQEPYIIIFAALTGILIKLIL